VNAVKLQVKRGIFTKKRVKQSEFDYFERIKSVLVKSKKPFKITGRSGVIFGFIC